LSCWLWSWWLIKSVLLFDYCNHGWSYGQSLKVIVPVARITYTTKQRVGDIKDEISKT